MLQNCNSRFMTDKQTKVTWVFFSRLHMCKRWIDNVTNISHHSGLCSTVPSRASRVLSCCHHFLAPFPLGAPEVAINKPASPPVRVATRFQPLCSWSRGFSIWLWRPSGRGLRRCWSISLVKPVKRRRWEWVFVCGLPCHP